MTALSCADAMRRLWQYLDEALPEADEKDVRQHIEECARCRAHEVFERRLLAEIAAVRYEHGELAALRDRIAAALGSENARVDRRDA